MVGVANLERLREQVVERSRIKNELDARVKKALLFRKISFTGHCKTFHNTL